MQSGVAARPSIQGRRPSRIIGWVVSLVLIALGVTLIVLGLKGPDVGPTLPAPIGVTSVQPGSSVVTPTPSGATTQSPVGTTPSPTSSSSSQSVTSTPSSVTSTVTSASLADWPASTATIQPRPTGLSGAASVTLTGLSSRTRHRVVRSTRVPPIHLSIPALHMSVGVSQLGLNRDGSPAVPTNFQLPGWYKFGPSPGQRGSAVILGHVDSYRGRAVFYSLVNLRPGNRIFVTLANGRKVQFAVIGLRMYTKRQFPIRLVYGPRTYSALQLVTCGGVFDHRTGHYLSNIVVFTAQVK